MSWTETDDYYGCQPDRNPDPNDKYRYHLRKDQYWYIVRFIGPKGSSAPEYLHHGGWWLDNVDADGDGTITWGGYFPSKAAAVATFRKQYNSNVILSGESKSETICLPDDDTYGTINFLGTEQVMNAQIGQNTGTGWYVSRPSADGRGDLYLHNDGSWHHNTGWNGEWSAYFGSKAAATANFRRWHGNAPTLTPLMDWGNGKDERVYGHRPGHSNLVQIQEDGKKYEYHLFDWMVAGTRKFYFCRYTKGDSFSSEYWYSKDQSWTRISLAHSECYGSAWEAMADIRKSHPTVFFKNEKEECGRVASTQTTPPSKNGEKTMCQGVIGLLNTIDHKYYWGVGSHTQLIKETWPQSGNTAGDKLVRFEADLAKGPGAFTVEGGIADADARAEIKNKLLDQVGTVDLLLDYALRHKKWDDAFGNIISSSISSSYDFWDSLDVNEDVRKAKLAYNAAVSTNTAYRDTFVVELQKPARDRAVTRLTENKNAYYAALADRVKKAATFSDQDGYAKFLAETVHKVDTEVRRITEENDLDLQADLAAAKRDAVKQWNVRQDNKEKAKQEAAEALVLAKVKALRDWVYAKPETVREPWRSTLKKADETTAKGTKKTKK